MHSIDFPIGTRLIVGGKTLEVVADGERPGCRNCAVRRPSLSEMSSGMVTELFDDPTLIDGICTCLECMDREDDECVHWQLIE